jgi:hypothetical protein
MAKLIENDSTLGLEDKKALDKIFKYRHATPAEFASVVTILFKIASTSGEGKLLAGYDQKTVTQILGNLKDALRGF